MMTRQLLRTAAIYAAVYIVTAPLLLMVEHAVASTYCTSAVALSIVLISTVFFAYSLAVTALQLRLLRTASKAITGFYLAANVLRLFLAAILLVGYAILAPREGLPLFALNLAVYYLLTVIISARRSIKAEQQNHHAQ